MRIHGSWDAGACALLHECLTGLLVQSKYAFAQTFAVFHCFAAEGGCPDTTFIEDAVHVLLKTRRILKCSYPYGFFLEPKSTKKEIFELMQVRCQFKLC